MERGVSLYLDLTRFSAAMAVFLGHAASQSISGGLLWQIYPYQHTAVIVFFVLSGYVIAHVLREREADPREYAIARIARLYSVVIPALLVTALCQQITNTAADQSVYFLSGNSQPTLAQFLATGTFTNRVWIFDNLDPALNGPFWSLSFEASYYLAAGVIFFTKGWSRVFLIGVLSVLAGPLIIVLAPVWFAGMGLYHLSKRFRPSKIGGLFIAALGFLLLLCGPTVRENARDVIMLGERVLVADYFEMLAFGMHIWGLTPLTRYLEQALGWCARLVRWLGSLTFALYLFHWPILLTLTAHKIGPVGSLEQRIYVYGLPLFIVATLGWWCETQKTSLKNVISSFFRRQAPEVSL